MSLKDSIWWTRKARIQSEKRLLSNDFHAQLLLLWYSFIGVSVSIFSLVYPIGNNINAVWVAFSVLIFCVAGFINGLSFKERAGLIKDCYIALKMLHQKHTPENEKEISREYEKVIELCENHTDRDYYWAVCEAYWSRDDNGQLTKKPNCYMRLVVFAYFIRKYFFLFVLYIAIPLIPAMFFIYV
ncbi:SLATT domain-containing protein [Piscirickettsia salmonis]|uniref:SLATT domain-containing protein n=1 Tax=Piscirickettsia salmonis TaxID=1238 RepID=UPI003EBBDA3B